MTSVVVGVEGGGGGGGRFDQIVLALHIRIDIPEQIAVYTQIRRRRARRLIRFYTVCYSPAILHTFIGSKMCLLKSSII